MLVLQKIFKSPFMAASLIFNSNILIMFLVQELTLMLTLMAVIDIIVLFTSLYFLKNTYSLFPETFRITSFVDGYRYGRYIRNERVYESGCYNDWVGIHTVLARYNMFNQDELYWDGKQILRREDLKKKYKLNVNVKMRGIKCSK
jgi:hypothetical protein